MAHDAVATVNVGGFGEVTEYRVDVAAEADLVIAREATAPARAVNTKLGIDAGSMTIVAIRAGDPDDRSPVPVPVSPPAAVGPPGST